VIVNVSSGFHFISFPDLLVADRTNHVRWLGAAEWNPLGNDSDYLDLLCYPNMEQRLVLAKRIRHIQRLSLIGAPPMPSEDWVAFPFLPSKSDSGF
jgi:hypothetical protein